MGVRCKVYTDNKGVGGCEVIVNEEHVQQVVGAIQDNFASVAVQEKSLRARTLFVCEDGALKDVLFVGECTHVFTVAVGRLCGVLPTSGQTEPALGVGAGTRWCSTELRWPTN